MLGLVIVGILCLALGGFVAYNIAEHRGNRRYKRMMGNTLTASWQFHNTPYVKEVLSITPVDAHRTDFALRTDDYDTVVHFDPQTEMATIKTNAGSTYQNLGVIMDPQVLDTWLRSFALQHQFELPTQVETHQVVDTTPLEAPTVKVSRSWSLGRRRQDASHEAHVIVGDDHPVFGEHGSELDDDPVLEPAGVGGGPSGQTEPVVTPGSTSVLGSRPTPPGARPGPH